MLRWLLRRLLWVVPTLIGTTLATFILVSYVPGPIDDPNVLAILGEERAAEARRSRFVDLPRFFNRHPTDVRERVRQTVERLRTDPNATESARRSLSLLGGAALPFVLPQLDSLDPSTRAKVALALQPIAERMGIRAESALDPARAVAFWNRYWSDRALDFRPANARRAVRRLSQHATVSREVDLFELDTFVLEPLMAELALLVPTLRSGVDKTDVVKTRVLVAVAEHVTGRADAIEPAASRADAEACIRRWQAWWLVHGSDYVAYDGLSRMLGMIADTQYAKWTQRILFFGLTGAAGDEPIGKVLAERAPTTLFITFGALFLAYAATLFLALLGRSERDLGRRCLPLGLALLTYAIPTAYLATLWDPGPGSGRLLAATATLALGLIASPLAQEHVLGMALGGLDDPPLARAGRPCGSRLSTRWLLLDALVPIATLSSLDLPVALGGAFVVETAFGLAGLGEPTIRAVQARDTAWLVTLAFGSVLIVMTMATLGDFFISMLNPRLSALLSRHRRLGP